MYTGFSTAGASKTEQHKDINEDKYLTFWSNDQLFGISIGQVQQIIGVQEITPVPEYPPYAKGIINLRGSIIPVIDVRLRFHRQETQYNERTCIIITDIEEILVGFIVDGVDEVASISREDISPPPKLTHNDKSSAYLSGVGKQGSRVILLLDTQKVITPEEMQLIVQEIN